MQTLNRTSKPVKLKEANFSPVSSVKFNEKGTLPRAGVEKAKAPARAPSSDKLPRMMTGKKTARSYARRLARITPAHSVQKTTQGTLLPGANFMASETKNEDVEIKKFPQGPNEVPPLAPTTALRSAMASISMKSLKQNLQWALKKDDPGHNVDPEGEVMNQIAGAPFNKSDNAAAVDTEELLQQQKSTAEYSFK
jgi:hypothetical protein